MRTALVNTLIGLAEKDKNIYLLVGDLGFSVWEGFREKFPERFINCGVAEQSMMGIAAGLALSGKKPYVYSIIPFVTMRCFEQIRNDVCYQNLDVKIIGVGSGLAYSYLGATHHAIEDIAILRALPNMTILSPADSVESRALTLESYQTKDPTYIRLNRGGESQVHQDGSNIKLGEPAVLEEGKDGVLVATGVFVDLAKRIAEKLKEEGKEFKVISLHTLKPIKKELLLAEIGEREKIFTLEEHNIIGGLGSALAEILMEAGYKGKFQRIGIPDQYPKKAGGVDYLRECFGLAEEEVLKIIKG